MNPCENYQELISRMIDGDLSDREKADLTRHMETCAECAALYRAFSAISRQLGDDLVDAPFDLRENVMADIRREEIRRKNRIPTILRGILSAAACVAVIVGVYLGVSLTKNEQLSAAVYDTAPAVAEEKLSVKAEESGLTGATEFAVTTEGDTPEAAEEALPEEAAYAFEPASNAMPMEEPAMEMETANLTGSTNAGMALADAGAGNVPEALVLDFSRWDRALFRELLGGDPTALTQSELESSLTALALVQNGDELVELSLYELDGHLYYYDPVEDAVYLAALTPEEFSAFLEG